jgi:hypothetical protein
VQLAIFAFRPSMLFRRTHGDGGDAHAAQAQPLCLFYISRFARRDRGSPWPLSLLSCQRASPTLLRRPPTNLLSVYSRPSRPPIRPTASCHSGGRKPAACPSAKTMPLVNKIAYCGDRSERLARWARTGVRKRGVFWRESTRRFSADFVPPRQYCLDFLEPALAGLVALATSFSWWFPDHSIPFNSRL